ncbi:alpha/beta hydrolase-fold protein [Clostridium intestinale]|uniref:alpha/beta hydrolase n=1 Tax=Clostridium intestinale TaxID=36845 RepID=UPI0028EDD286|nr:alpha/beta hydrolase-fold protein [Clostridium intestinale]
MNGEIIEEFFKERKLFIYLPPSYSNGEQGFPVVYVQDGDYLFGSKKAIEELEVMFKNGELKEIILVGVTSNKRNDEYTPWYGKPLAEKFDDFGGKGKEYLDFLVNELKVYIDNKYSTLKGNTAIAGASLGALISLYGAYIYPEVFNKFGCISPSLWYEGFLEFMSRENLEVSTQRIYMDVGSKEGSGKKSIQLFMPENVEEGYRLISSKALNPQNVKFIKEEGASHTEEAFVRRFPNAIKWLFS